MTKKSVDVPADMPAIGAAEPADGCAEGCGEVVAWAAICPAVLVVRKKRIEQSRNPQQKTAREAILLAPGSRRAMHDFG